MTPETSGRRRAVQVVVRVLGAALTLLCVVPLVWFATLAVRSRFEWSFDPHGYQLVFGTLLAIALCLPASLFLPLVFPAGRRVKPLLISIAVFFLIGVALFVMLSTA